ncbi:hypothetical protein HN51_027527 [Arachis hypogaea]
MPPLPILIICLFALPLEQEPNKDAPNEIPTDATHATPDNPVPLSVFPPPQRSNAARHIVLPQPEGIPATQVTAPSPPTESTVV